MNAPADQSHRDRFVNGLTENFSVIASAGSGKTRAVTDRIVAIAKSGEALEWLPALVVVTYTNRAADEMQQRARQRILEEGVPLPVLAAFNRAFFGTIHGFCVRLLRQHGHHLAAPAQPDLLTDDDTLWMEFMQKQTKVGTTLSATQRECLLRLAPVRQLMELGRSSSAAGPAEDPDAFPAFDFTEVLAVVGKGTGKKNIEASQERLRRWADEWANGEGFLPPPQCLGTSKDFVPLWTAALDPIRGWLRRASLHVAAEVAHAYRAFRLAKGVVTYDDQVTLASELLRHPEAARRIREKNYRVILDEAQDTDPAQFDVLLELARPPDASGAWLDTQADPPRPGHFCMVGDFQQSIFGDRADLDHYRRVHETLLATRSGREVEFSVTFRLDQRQIDFVNKTFPAILDDTAKQVAFVELSARPDVLPGQVVRLDLDVPQSGEKVRDVESAWIEAGQLAKWLRRQGLSRLRAESWSEVAVLCPRKGWFVPLRAALRAEKFDVQIQSERDLQGDSPAYAWFTALAVIMADPRDSYEIVGVLREVFGISDHDLAVFAEGKSEGFHIAGPPERTGVVSDMLRLLAETHARAAVLPLFSAMGAIVLATQLRERLLTLPAEDFENLDSELDDLLTLAAAHEAEGGTLADFAGMLRDGFGATREVRPATRDAIQLITAHKAKGSEWQVVVVPFFARRAAARSPSYPRIVRHPQTGEAHVALSSEDIASELKDALDLKRRQEAERLLYVALTRSRNTLVIVDDRALFRTKTGLSPDAQASHLRCAPDGANAGALSALPDIASACAATAAQQVVHAASEEREHAVAPIAPGARTIAVARARAAVFVKRNPSALAEAYFADASAAPPRTSGLPNAGTLYGTWWHEFVERLDWTAAPTARDATLAEALPASPDPERSRREWALLRAALAGDSQIAQWLVRGERRVLPELPFLWAMNDRECLEGIIDLALWNADFGGWLILDWKTNLETADLAAHYEPQLAAYWQSATEMLHAPVTAALYSTVTGAWLPYEAARLAGTWKRIATDPGALAAALARD